MKKSFQLLLCLLLVACGSGKVQIDSSALPANSTANPVGLLEVQNTKPNKGAGITLGNTNFENSYCTALVSNSGSIEVHSSCLYKADNTLVAADDLRVYLKRPDMPGTGSFAIKSIQAIHSDADNAWAELEPEFADSIAQTYGNLDAADESPSADDLLAGTKLSSVSIQSPDSSGQARLVVTSISFDAQQKYAELVATNRKLVNSDPKATSLKDDDKLELAKQGAKKDLCNLLTHPTKIRIHANNEISDTGSVVLYHNHALAIANHRGEAQWLHRRLKVRETPNL